MALWKDQTKVNSPLPQDAASSVHFDAPVIDTKPEPINVVNTNTTNVSRVVSAGSQKSESLIAPDIAIEGKIEGAGHVRIAGRFKGDVNVRGDLTIEAGAQVNGSVRADKIVIAGELIGNIEAATHVDLLQSGALTGDVKATTLTVAAGSRMRGQADFGWDDAHTTNGARNGAAARNGASHGLTT